MMFVRSVLPVGSVPSFLWTFLALFSLTQVDAFAPLVPVTTQGRTGKLTVLEQSSNKNDEVDDWFADFDPSQFDKDVSVINKSNSNSNDGDRYSSNAGSGRPYAQDRYAARPARSSGGERGGGRGGDRSSGSRRPNENGAAAGYTRDTSRDRSNVDEAAVEALIVERSRARQTGDFDRADAAKERLLREHGVQIWDRDRVWRSGCSGDSGSGMQRPGGRGGGNMRDGDRGGDRRGRSMDSMRTPRDFGPKGHDYVMADDAGPIAAGLSEAEIDQRIAERLQYKLSRNYEEADRIQNELNSRGVYIIDRQKVWRADGQSFGDNDSGSRGGMRDGGRGRGDRRESSRGPPRQRDFGPKGHDYVMADDAGPITADLSEAEIDEQLAERLQYKFARNYDEADRIQNELNSRGVFVHDGQKVWRADGKPIGDNDRFSNGPQRDRNSRNQPYEMSEYSSDGNLSDDDLQTIDALVAQRLKAKLSRDYDSADELRYKLDSEYNVKVDDRLRQWSVGGNFGPVNGDNNRGNKNDNLRDRAFVRRGGGNLTKEQVAEIAELVQERDEAKRNFDYETADAIRDALDARFSVRVDDRSREWRVISDDYVMSQENGGSTDVDSETVDYIQRRLKERSEYKKNRDFDAADEIRDDLRDNYGVSIDDRTREWSVRKINEYSVVGDDEPPRERRFRMPIPDGITVDDDDNDDLEDDDEYYPEAEVSGDESMADTNFDSELDEGLSGLTVPELKERLREAGLPVSGRKAELIERLTLAK